MSRPTASTTSTTLPRACTPNGHRFAHAICACGPDPGGSLSDAASCLTSPFTRRTHVTEHYRSLPDELDDLQDRLSVWENADAPAVPFSHVLAEMDDDQDLPDGILGR